MALPPTTTSRTTARDYDVCIVGAGIAGALVAYKLGRAGIRTVILEAGRRRPPPPRMDYMESRLRGEDPWFTDDPDRDVFTNGGEIDYRLNHNRVKAVGGSTMHWIGYTPRFHADDFRMKSRFGIANDWPISYDELETYYGEAEVELGVAGADDNPFASPRSRPFPLPPFPIGYEERIVAEAANALGIKFHTMPQARNSVAYGGRPQCLTYSVCRTCPIGAKYSADVHVALAEATGNVTVLSEANVTRLETGAAGKVRRAVYIDAEGRESDCAAGTFVVAAHAVESARLLLLSASGAHPHGLANSNGLVGRFFMEHRRQNRTVHLDRPVYPHRKGFVTTFSEQYHHVDRATGAAFWLYGESGGAWYTHIVDDVVARSGLWGEELAEHLRKRLAGEYGRTLVLGSNAEPLPSESNRVELDPDVKDRFGNPCPKLFYSLSDYEHTAYAAGDEVMHGLADAMGARGVGPITPGFGGHHAGTCRMGNEPERSVVDRNLKAHEVENLYVVGSSNFVTLSIVNPTLTIAALSLRLGDHLTGRRGANGRAG